MRWILALLVVATCGATCTRGSVSDDETASGDGAGRFVAVGEATVRDTTTGLVWTAHDNEQNFPWPEAERHCGDLRLDDHEDWRLPTIEELGAIYDQGQERACGERTCRLDPAITLSDPYVWSATGRDPGRRFYIDFKFGTQLAPMIRPSLVRRVLCVRPG